MPSRYARLREEILELRRSGGVKSARLGGLAKRLGRTLVPRGKHPTWVSQVLPEAPPLSIPDHGGRDLNRHTAGVILDQLEADLDRLEAKARGSD